MALMPARSSAISANSPQGKARKSLGWLGNVVPHCLPSLEALLGLGPGSSYIELDYQSAFIQ